ncbi:helix-turn-helix domain-containing protein [Cohnella lupini]|uniref:Excisionase family DNA binding protein n=1 Tax=Cohnella lupini TaxID=1294267 RepID=A0A3D9HRF2_9BACL|nr:helix-turn-helix domain-containing protein [Cohnella lupini]RED51891.1 excisionase family DNA binding protein [Cohnella lupini]
MNPLNEIMSTEEASKLWGVHQDHVKRLCREGKVICRKFGKTYILRKNQPKPGIKKAIGAVV